MRNENRNSKAANGARASLPAFGSMTSDLEQPCWSVLSDRGCEANGLTHEEARRLVHRLGGEGRHGLCIVTDEAEGRITAGSQQPETTVKH